MASLFKCKIDVQQFTTNLVIPLAEFLIGISKIRRLPKETGYQQFQSQLGSCAKISYIKVISFDCIYHTLMNIKVDYGR